MPTLRGTDGSYACLSALTGSHFQKLSAKLVGSANRSYQIHHVEVLSTLQIERLGDDATEDGSKRSGMFAFARLSRCFECRHTDSCFCPRPARPR